MGLYWVPFMQTAVVLLGIFVELLAVGEWLSEALLPALGTFFLLLSSFNIRVCM